MAVRSFVVNLTAQFPNPKAFFPHLYNNKMQTTDLFINGVNSYFDSQKPDFAMQCPFFFDWVDLNNGLHDYDTWAKLVGMVFYGEVYDKAKHFGVLPYSQILELTTRDKHSSLFCLLSVTKRLKSFTLGVIVIKLFLRCH